MTPNGSTATGGTGLFGSVVLHDVPAGETVHGAPARVPATSA